MTDIDTQLDVAAGILRRSMRRKKMRRLLIDEGYRRQSTTPKSEDGSYAETWRHRAAGDVVVLGFAPSPVA